MVNIINIDSKIPNLALEKVRKYYIDKGFTINDQPIFVGIVPTFISVVFDWNKNKVEKYEGLPNVYIGGSGYDLKSKLPKEIEMVNPKINMGFTTRGCIRECPFCIVPEKEGKIKAVADIYDIWDGKAKEITLFDNNIFAHKKHFKLIASQLIKENLSIDFNQGLDIRLLNNEYCEILEQLKFNKDVRFALDDFNLIPLVREKLSLLRKYKIRKNYFFYVISGFDTSFEDDYARLKFLKKENCRPYLQRHKSVKGKRIYTRCSQWVNQFWTFQKYDFKTFIREYEKDMNVKTRYC